MDYLESTVHEDGRRELKVFKDGVLVKHEFDLTKEESEALKARKGWFQRAMETGHSGFDVRTLKEHGCEPKYNFSVHGAVENKGGQND